MRRVNSNVERFMGFIIMKNTRYRNISRKRVIKRVLIRSMNINIKSGNNAIQFR
jgi:hypothetical protein